MIHDNWSISLGRWGGLNVRLHMLFLLFTAFSVYLGWLEQKFVPGALTLAILGLAVLFASVLVHELGHVYAAGRVGGYLEQIVIGPLGGLEPVFVPDDPHAELVCHLAGPLTNLFVCAFCSLILLLHGDAHLLSLMHPLQPANLGVDWTAISLVRLAFWVNWVLLLINLLPAFPFDGGRALRSALSPLWEELGDFHATLVVNRVAKLAAIVVLFVAWWNRGETLMDHLPLWLPLCVLGIVLFFASWEEPELPEDEDDEAEDTLFGYDFSQGYTSLEQADAEPPAKTGLLSRWLDERREARDRRTRESEAEEERRVDEILARLHRDGPNSLSPDDRGLLERVSARYRARNQSG